MATPLPPLLLKGSCLDELKRIPDASIDAVVTDPPYGLANTDPSHVVEALTKWAQGERDFLPTGRGFMGKEWDAFVPPPAVWDECMRILKPGGHLLAFAGSRTFDLMTLSVRMAGFDIRDSIAWLYGSGFPKSMDVSKAIDKVRDDTADVRVVCRWLRARIDEHPTQTVATIAERFGFHPRMVEHWAARDTDSQPSLPKLEQWDALRSVLGFGDEHDAEVLRLNLRKGEPGEAWKDRPVTGQVQEWTDRTNYAITSRDGLRRDEPATDAAREWQGWGTALKPAFEPVVVARKPLVGTVAANVLVHGTGALNIDATRIEAHDAQLAEKYASVQKAGARENSVYGADSRDRAGAEPNAAGRWPANVILDESQAAALDEQSGTLTSGKMKAGTKRATRRGDALGTMPEETGAETVGDSGGASRFFTRVDDELHARFIYQAKAPGKERPSYETEDGQRVSHATVKPLALMRWLIRLVTPSSGCVVDPFAGSGTTLEAAYLEGFESIGVELTADYWPLIEQRITRVTEKDA